MAFVKIGALKRITAEGKLKTMRTWVEDWLEATEEKLVIFTVHRSVLTSMKEWFPESAVVDGSISGHRRQQEVDRFQTQPDCRVLLGQLRAAGIGLTLTASSTVLFLEIGWTPAEHDQAEDRVCRIGQTSSKINAYYAIATSTIEEKILNLLSEKRQTISRVLDGRASSSHVLTAVLESLERESK